MRPRHGLTTPLPSAPWVGGMEEWMSHAIRHDLEDMEELDEFLTSDMGQETVFAQLYQTGSID